MSILFKAEHLVKNYPRSGFRLEVPSIELPAGSITGVVGENGNGKTTLLSIIAGQLSADGKFQYFGHSTYEGMGWSKIKDDIAFIPQRIPRWYGTLIQNLKLKAALEKIPADQIDDYLDEILDFLDLQKFRDLYWKEISTGFRLRFELARVLIGQPKLLVLDEPLANLDINTQQKFLSDLKSILRNKDYETAVVLSSQQLHEIETVADHMIFLKQGKTVFSGNVDNMQGAEENNIYEFQVEDDSTFESLLIEANYEFSKRGEYYQVKTGLDVSFSDIMSLFIQKGVQLKYSRDISKSTKRLFEN